LDTDFIQIKLRKVQHKQECHFSDFSDATRNKQLIYHVWHILNLYTDYLTYASFKTSLIMWSHQVSDQVRCSTRLLAAFPAKSADISEDYMALCP